MHGAKAKHDGRGFWRDAKLLEKSMAGLGTKDTQLIYRFVLPFFGKVIIRFFFLLTTALFIYFSDSFVLIGILIVLKPSRTLIDDDTGKHLNIV